MQNPYLTELVIKYDLNEAKQVYISNIPDKKISGKDIIPFIPKYGSNVFAQFKTNKFNKKNKLIKGTIVSFSKSVLDSNLFSHHELLSTFETDFKPFENLYIFSILKMLNEFRLEFWTEPAYIVKHYVGEE